MDSALLGSTLVWGSIGSAVACTFLPERASRRALAMAMLLAVSASLTLTVALIGSDFSLAYVAETTSRATPWPYRLAALWGGMEGSMLFYSTLLLGVGFVGVRRAGRVERSVVALAGTGGLLLTALGANPFEVLAVPAVDGEGLLAILQHPAMVYHPPILYLGLTILVVPFALTTGALTRGDDVSLGRPMLTSWTLLTLGMVAGANWAYIELGWGGFWAWDPVENTALMPWLAATAWLHTSKVTARDARLRRSTWFLAAFPFALSVMGVYLTRSGVTGSIHSFAEDPVVGRVLLVAAAVVTLVTLYLTLRAEPGKSWGRIGVARDLWLLISAVLVSAVLVFVVIGSAYPAYVQVFGDRSLSVDPRFFVVTVLPIALVVALLIGFALKTGWSRAQITISDLIWHGAASLTAGVAAVVGAIELAPAAVPLIALAGGALVLLTRDLSARRPGRSAIPAHLAHLGLAMVLLGAGASALGTQFVGEMSVGETIRVGSHRISLVEIEIGEEGRYLFASARFDVDGEYDLTPEIRAYEDQPVPVGEPVMRSTPLSDLIIAVSQLAPDAESLELSVFLRPMVWWVWAGAVMMALAGSFGLLARVGAGAGPRRAATEEPLPAETTSGSSAR